MLAPFSPERVGAPFYEGTWIRPWQLFGLSNNMDPNANLRELISPEYSEVVLMYVNTIDGAFNANPPMLIRM